MNKDHLNDALALHPKTARSRRDFLRTSAYAGGLMGFATAAQPVLGQQLIKTDFTGIKAGEKTIDMGSEDLYAYVAEPEKKKTANYQLSLSPVRFLVCTSTSQILQDDLPN